MRGKHTFVIMLLIMTSAISVRGQEKQIPFDVDQKIQSVTPDLAKRAGLFQYVHQFQEAKVYQLPDSSYVLEIHYLRDWQLYKERRPITVQELDDLRATIAMKAATPTDPLAPSPAARVKFVTGMMFLGLGYYGWALPVIVEPDNENGNVGLYFLGSGLTFLTAYYSTPARGIPESAAMLGLYGGTRGILHGFVLRQWIDTDSDPDNDDEAQTMVGAGMVMSIMETMAGYSIARNSRMMPGTAGVIGACGDFGMLVGGATGSLIGKGIDRRKDEHHYYYDYPYFYDSDDEHIYQRRWTYGSALVGSAGGFLAGALLARDEPYTKGDGRVLLAAGLLGIGAAFSFNDVFNTGSEDKTEAALIAGPVVGVAAGHLLTRGKDFSSEQGTIVFLHTLTGGLLGLGISQMVNTANDNDEDFAIVYVTAGGAGAFLLGYSTFRHAAESAAMSQLDFHAAPTGLLARGENGERRVVPGVALRIEF